MAGLFRPLMAEEIEVRVGSVMSDGATLLLFKDSRCDMNILDETVGAMNWKRSHSRDNANCTVSIYNEKIGEWVSKEDTGTESYTEREKGLASDSFKRACVNWGIGRELYTSPRIKIKCETKPKGNGGYELSNRWEFWGVEVTRIGYDDSGNINELEIVKGNNIIFSLDENVNHYPDVKKAEADMTNTITEAQRKTLIELMREANVDIDKIIKTYKVDSIVELTQEQYGNALNRLKATKEKKK